MEIVFVFDVDGTLTDPRQPMDARFADFFDRFARKNTVILVSGSDLPKLKEQLPNRILESCSRIYTCSGAECWSDGKLIYRKEHEFPPALIECCEAFVDLSSYGLRFGNHLEHRPGMLNVTVVGRNATNEQRKHYFEWDRKERERAQFVDIINNSDRPYEAAAGGEISIDIAPRGWNKSVILPELFAHYPNAAIKFYGDRTERGGNDWPLADALAAAGAPHASLRVFGYLDTWRHLLDFVEIQASLDCAA